MHQTLGGVAGTAEVVLQRTEPQEPWCNANHRPGIGNRGEPLLNGLGDNGDGHGERVAEGHEKATSDYPRAAAYLLSGLATIKYRRAFEFELCNSP